MHVLHLSINTAIKIHVFTIHTSHIIYKKEVIFPCILHPASPYNILQWYYCHYDPYCIMQCIIPYCTVLYCIISWKIYHTISYDEENAQSDNLYIYDHYISHIPLFSWGLGGGVGTWFGFILPLLLVTWMQAMMYGVRECPDMIEAADRITEQRMIREIAEKRLSWYSNMDNKWKSHTMMQLCFMIPINSILSYCLVDGKGRERERERQREKLSWTMLKQCYNYINFFTISPKAT